MFQQNFVLFTFCFRSLMHEMLNWSVSWNQKQYNIFFCVFGLFWILPAVPVSLNHILFMIWFQFDVALARSCQTIVSKTFISNVTVLWCFWLDMPHKLYYGSFYYSNHANIASITRPEMRFGDCSPDNKYEKLICIFKEKT